MRDARSEVVNTLVIGGGQAGLSVGYHLKQRGVPFLIVDAHPRIGDAWRTRWDSLRLFTPTRYSSLAGMPHTGRGDRFIGKDEMADYLEAYAARFELPLRTSTRVERLEKIGDRFVATAGDRTFEADQVVVAMGSHQVARTPEFAKDLDPRIRQIHSLDYLNPSQLADGDVLVVGVGNSGADIAMEVVRTHRVWLAGKEAGVVPFPIESFFGRNIGIRMVRFLGHHVLSVRTPIGRKVRPSFMHRAAPLIRVKPWDLEAAGVERVPRIVGVTKGLPQLADERTISPANVIWCTGSVPGFSWIRLPIHGTDGELQHEHGIAREPGLYFVGLEFLYSATSATISGMRRDAARIAKAVASRKTAARPGSMGREVAAA
jgi:putative flavoprotein involved in K+ transport